MIECTYVSYYLHHNLKVLLNIGDVLIRERPNEDLNLLLINPNLLNPIKFKLFRRSNFMILASFAVKFISISSLYFYKLNIKK